ncbi:unnamed protein product [Phytomonas sp. EM1]|nr:unnamed protein product [Phytomonas sp. EM1]|eukprot:CCW61486.1 unnamed protein product [Phytomonas sp. isolate EM1]
MGDRKQEVAPGCERDSKDVGEATSGLSTDDVHAEGYAPEATTNQNMAAAEQTQEQETHINTGANWEEFSNTVIAADRFDPMEEQVYYYQDEDGNYYCYTNPQLVAESETYDSAHTHVARDSLARYHEYINWRPRKYAFPIDVIVYTFVSNAYKLYLSLLLYSAGVLIILTGLDYTFSVVYHIYNPPSKEKQVMQVICFLSMFFYLTFAIVNIICVMLDMLTNIWSQKLDDIQFWGMSHMCISKRKPPYLVYLTIFIATVILPLIWSVVDAASSNNTALYWLQCYAAVAVIVAVFMVIVCYVWFYWRSIVYKSSALRKYKKRDEFPYRKEAYKHHPEKMRKTHWYHAQTVLEEFGFDRISVRCDSIVFTVGCVPLFAMCAVQVLSTYTGDPSVLWAAIASLALVCIYTVTWLSLFQRKNHWYIYMTLLLNFAFLIFGIIGGLSTGEPSMAGVVVLLWFISQYMLIRRRIHSLSDKELRTMLEIPPDYKAEEERHKVKINSYLFCCNDVILDYASCSSKMYFQHKHPDVRAAEESRNIDRMALRSDQKVLLVWWFFVFFAVAFVIGVGNTVRYMPKGNIAQLASAVQAGTDPNSPVCQVVYNSNGNAPLKLYDLALLSALSFTYSTFSDNDFATWFSHRKDFTRVYPKKLPPTLDYQTDGTAIRYSVYNDNSSSFYIITLNSNSRGLSVFRNMNDWGESIVLRVAEAITPLISLWPDSYKKGFVQNAKFFKDWFPRSNNLDNVRKTIELLIEKGFMKNILLVGDQFNGGYAKLLSDEYNIPFFAFNSPGVGYKLSSMVNGSQISAVRGLWSYVDSLEDSGIAMRYPCASSHSSANCTRITAVIDYIYNLCGDPYRRIIRNI